MAEMKKLDKKSVSPRVKLSWKTLFVALSVTVNIGLVVLVTTMMTTNALDGMLIKEGLTRYCDSANDDKFAGSTASTIMLRDYTCERNGADIYFRDGYQKYLDSQEQ